MGYSRRLMVIGPPCWPSIARNCAIVASSLALNSATFAATTSFRAPDLRSFHCCCLSILRVQALLSPSRVASMLVEDELPVAGSVAGDVVEKSAGDDMR